MKPASLLIIDDEENLRKLMVRILQLEGHVVYEAANAKDSMKLLEKETIFVVISDVKLPDASGITLTSRIKERYPCTEIIVLTAYGTIEDGVQAMKNGAFDYLVKGNDNNKLVPLVAKAAEKAQLQYKIKELEQKLNSKITFESIIGTSDPLKAAIELAKKVAKTDTTVLLTGDTGTGKEVFAQAIYSESGRKDKSFVALNCSAFAKDVIESELFGYKAGAFTGAHKDKKGLFEEAHEGTIFLDEIGEMEPGLQARLLRVLETQEFIKVGDTKPTKVNVRVIAATNRDLLTESEEGRFRADLYYRLSIFQIRMPSLSDLTEDIPAFAEHFVKYFSSKTNKKVTLLAPEFLKSLQSHQWKGNIRELKNIIERAVILAEGIELKSEHLPFNFNSGSIPANTFDMVSMEKDHIRKVLEYVKGNKPKAAELLNIGLTTLYRKIEEYHLT